MPAPQAFSLHVPDAAIADLKDRLARARFPDCAPGDPWAHGASVDYMRDLIAHWRDRFDWRAAEARLNGFPQFKLSLDDVDLHYLHVPGRGPNPKPLLLMHGWPGSVFEFLDFIPRLTDPAAHGGDPADAFTVIAPSLPGYGLSFRPGQARYGVEEIAEALVALMSETLGYPRFGVQGGDWGGIVAAYMAQAFPRRLIGAHVNMLAVPRDPKAIAEPDEEQKAFQRELKAWADEETGYQWIQGTKPQTLSFALSDSPLGLAAWLVEKFRSWSDCGGEIERAIERDRMLANISFYWFTGAIGASFYPYYFRKRRPWPVSPERPATAPVGYASFPKEMLHPPRSIAQKSFKDIRRWTEMPRGGHFAAMEQPELLAADVRAFFRELD